MIKSNLYDLIGEEDVFSNMNPATRQSTEVTPWIPLRGLALQRQKIEEPTDVSPWSFRDALNRAEALMREMK